MKKILITLIILLITSSCTTTKMYEETIAIENKAEVGEKSGFLSEEINIIAESIENQLPYNSRVLILDFEDLEGIITYFGRYVTDRLYIRLSSKLGYITYIERQNIEYVLKEQQFQISGYVDEDTATKISRLTGATHILNGVVTELVNTICLDIKVLNVEKGTVIGGISLEIPKTREVASLISTIIETEEQKQKVLEEHREAILQEIEEEKQKRLLALEEEEKQKKAEIANLEKEIREKSIIIAEYERKKKVLEEKNDFVRKIHEQVDRLNLTVKEMLKIGMTYEQVVSVLGKDNVKQVKFDNCYLAGKWFLLFEGGVLVKVTPISSRVMNCNDAWIRGTNFAPF